MAQIRAAHIPKGKRIRVVVMGQNKTLPNNELVVPHRGGIGEQNHLPLGRQAAAIAVLLFSAAGLWAQAV
jgi:hypothetical protein